ncbi:MAG: DEAD/DEAH box helicase [Acidobacteria bacterium]|nr:DEAD/DEAH box helicase [Acidobacteriota bacterium]MBV9476584.1 DEAD/DEAH box helicase [Acidobacteriota bacterium]
MSNAAFTALGLRDELVAALTHLGYEAPTPIQERTIPVLLEGRDLIGQAQTGTGKTAAFALPILQRIDLTSRATQALVLAPTRELAMQVAEAVHSYAQKLTDVHVLPVYGGAPIVPQLKRLDRGAQIVVGTPGRLIDHLDRGSLKLDAVKLIVLDEADEMLKMGFIDDIERILSGAPQPRQTALFSATMPAEVLRIAQRYLVDPARVEIEHRALTAPAIEQRFLNVSEGQKLEVLTQILELEPNDATLIFRRTKTGSAELAEKLEARGFAAVAMHGDMTQPLRESVIRRLRAGQVDIVVATDVAARGLDVEQITHVVNYDIPYDVEAYVHRIGRTGRAGRSGVATLFITPRERRMMREIERYTNTPIKPMKMPTRADIAAHRVAQFKDNIRKTIGEGDLDLYLSLVEQLVDEGQFDIAEIAAAAAKIASSGRKLAVEPEPPRATAATPSAEIAAEDDRTVTLQMSVGKREGIRPADVVGSIANEANIPGRDIGPIDIRDEITYVGIPERFVEQVIASVGKARFRGRAVNFKRAERVPPPTAPSRREPHREPHRAAPRRDAREPYAPREFTPRRDARPASRDTRPDSRERRAPFGPKEVFGRPRYERDTRDTRDSRDARGTRGPRGARPFTPKGKPPKRGR